MFNMKDTCSTREAAKRLGVALSTVQSWVETGALEAWKTPGGHRRVFIPSVERLLREGISKPKQQPAPACDREPKSLRVLIVEDEPLARELYAGFFEQWHLPVVVGFCENGYEALLRIGHEIPDLIISDLSMPEMDGFQMIRALRQFPVTARLPIIAVSGLSDLDIEAQGGLSSDVLRLHKPVDIDQLHALLANAVALNDTSQAA